MLHAVKMSEPKKKGKAKALVTYKEKYRKDFPFATKLTKGPHVTFCTVCRCDINIAHGGRGDFVLHAKGKKHIENARLEQAASATPKIGTLLSKSNDFRGVGAEVSSHP